METVAFYSYKGGVGRSLLLASAAQFLAMDGKGVVALDLDLEAPGIHYKFWIGLDASIGAVPYLAATADGSAAPPPLADHTMTVALPEGAKG